MAYKITTDRALAPLIQQNGRPIGLRAGDEDARIQLATAYALIGIMERLERLGAIEDLLANISSGIDEVAEKTA